MRRVSSVLAVLAPLLGVLVADRLQFQQLQGFWQGLIIQIFLLLAPIDLIVRRQPPAWIGLKWRGLGPALGVGGGLATLYLVGLLVGAAVGIHLPHFDQARASLGLLPVLALYIPFWGLLEGVWVDHLVRTVTNWLGHERPTWPAILLAGGWFGLVHVVVQLSEGADPLGALVSLYIGVFAVLAGVLLRRTGNGWGFILFWVVVNF